MTAFLAVLAMVALPVLVLCVMSYATIEREDDQG